jgi:carboxypeptidase C (cathepsin A)
MKQAAPRCEKMMKAACVDVFDAMGCEAAKAFCGAELELPFLTTGLNGYDMSKPCEGEPDALCYPVTKQIAGWLARNDTRAALGVDAAVPAGFASCSSEVFAGFISTDDELNPTQLWVAGLLERGVRALIYVGEYDWICNWVGNARWVHALEWSGGDGFRAEEETTWEMDGQVKGRKRASGPLTFLTIRGAGHMVSSC